MNGYREKNAKLEYFCVISFIFLSIDTLLLGTNRDSRANTILVVLTAFITIVLFIRKLITIEHLEMARREFVCVMSMLFLLMTSQIKALIINENAVENQYLYNYILIVFVYEIGQIVSLESFRTKYVNVMALLAVAAIILYVADILGILNFFPSIIVTNTGGFQYHYFGVGAMMEHMQYFAIRAYGIFREPGVFAIYLCTAIGMELFFSKEIGIAKVSILSVALILTFSTAGYIVLIALISLYFLLRVRNKREFYFKLFIVIIAIVFSAFFLDKVYNQVFGKLHVKNPSLDSRVYSIVSGLEFSIRAPLLGLGWNYVSSNFEKSTMNRYGLGGVAFTNTYLRMAATYGWIYTLIMLNNIFLFFKRALKKNRPYNSKSVALCLLMIWIIMFSNEGMVLNPLLYLWMLNEEKIRNDSF